MIQIADYAEQYDRLSPREKLLATWPQIEEALENDPRFLELCSEGNCRLESITDDRVHRAGQTRFDIEVLFANPSTAKHLFLKIKPSDETSAIEATSHAVLLALKGQYDALPPFVKGMAEWKDIVGALSNKSLDEMRGYRLTGIQTEHPSEYSRTQIIVFKKGGDIFHLHINQYRDLGEGPWITR